MWFAFCIRVSFCSASAKSHALKTFFTHACARVYSVNVLADDDTFLHFGRVHGGMKARDLRQAFVLSKSLFPLFPVHVAQQSVPVLRGHWRTAQLQPQDQTENRNKQNNKKMPERKQLL